MNKCIALIKKYAGLLFGKSGSVVAKATTWFLICSILQKCLNMITMPIFMRIMSVEEIGEYTNYHTWRDIIIIISVFRLDYGVFNKGMSKFSDNRNEYTSTMIITTSMLSLMWMGIYLIFRGPINHFTELSTGVTCAIFAEMMIVPAMWFWLLSQRYEYKYKAVVGVTLASAVVNTITCTITVVLSSNKVEARIFTSIIVSVLSALIIYVICIKKSKKLFVWDYLKFAVLFNIPLIPHYFSAYLLEQSDKIMIRDMVGKTELGLYGTAATIAATIKIVTASMTNAILPWQYEALKKKEFKSIEKRLVSSVYLVTALILLFVCVAPEVMMILASQKYMDAIYAIPPLACSTIMIFYYSLVANIEFYYDKNKFVTIVSCVCAVINIIINYIGISTLGYLGAAYATYICYLIFVMLHMLYVNKVTREKEHISILRMSNAIIISIVTTVVIVVMTVLYRFPIYRYILLILMGIGAYFFRSKLIRLYEKYIKS